MANFEVIVSNIGTVYSGGFIDSARDAFAVYQNQSIKGIGRAAGESVTLFKDSELVREFNPENGYTNECIQCEAEFGEDNPCCCDDGCNDSELHRNGICKACCQHPYTHRDDYMDCDR